MATLEGRKGPWKWFSRLVTKVGLTDPVLVLYSLRHGGISKLHGAGSRKSSASWSVRTGPMP